MITLGQLLTDLALPADLAGLPVMALRLDSRAVRPGDVFLAVPGFRADGRSYIGAAVEAGAAAILQEGDAFTVDQSGAVPRIGIPGLGRGIGTLAARFYGCPADQLQIVGVTGTNGKTSITWFLRDALDAVGHRCGLVGTLGVGLKGDEADTGHTTPDPITLQSALHGLREKGADYVAMEVSSHALDQGRLGDTRVSCAVFSNLSRDHLDYHGSMDAYLNAKRSLFTRPGLAMAVINTDDDAASTLVASLDDGVRCVTFGSADGATVRCLEHRALPEGMEMVLSVGGEPLSLRLPLYGDFNLSNVMAVAGVLHGLGWSNEALGQGLGALTPVPGRMESLCQPGQPVVVVDYAHTPDGLEKALSGVRGHFPGRLWCVVGCGGDRDTGKRPLTGAVAERLADRVVLTSDNPRNEAPEGIIGQIRGGMNRPQDALCLSDRPEAVARAIAEAEAGDVVLIAGKGHERYQEVAGHRYPMDDRALARAALARRGGQA